MTIRRVPTDFVVEEVLREGVVSDRVGGYVVYALTKTSLTTEGATTRFAAALGVGGAQVSYAGLKDKHAHTTQHVSVARPGSHTNVPTAVDGEGWSARLAGWSKEPAAAAWIRRNRFTIVVRALTEGRCERMDRAAELLDAGGAREPGERRLLMANYFGDQRFGSARHGKGFVARHLVRGEFEEALRLAIGTASRRDTGKRRVMTRALEASWGRWDEALARTPRCPERGAVEVLASGGGFVEAFAALPHFFQRMCVEAYQSHLWNGMARRMVGMPAGDGFIREGAIVAEDAFGEYVFPFPARVGAGLRSLELPMLAPEVRPVQPWREAAEAVLKEEGLELKELRIPGLRRPTFGEAWRALFVLAERFGLSDPEADDLGGERGRMKRTATFELPRGAYATVLLRALGE